MGGGPGAGAGSSWGSHRFPIAAVLKQHGGGRGPKQVRAAQSGCFRPCAV